MPLVTSTSWTGAWSMNEYDLSAPTRSDSRLAPSATSARRNRHSASLEASSTTSGDGGGSVRRSSGVKPASVRIEACRHESSMPRPSRRSPISSSRSARSSGERGGPGSDAVGTGCSGGTLVANARRRASTSARRSAPAETAAAGLFISCASPAVSTPICAIRSDWRTRDSCSLHLLMKTSNSARFAGALSDSTSSRHAFGMASSVVSDSALAVALRGSALSRPISPTTSPSVETAIRTFRPADSFRISISPPVMM